jgi:hypothetical protein
MLQKAKTIKKTIKTEVKAIVHGQERVDKRGKPVTSIADRTNVSALSSFFHFNRFSKMVGCWGKLSASNALFFFVKMLLPREDTQQFFIKKTTTTLTTKRSRESNIFAKRPKKRDSFATIIIALTPRVSLFLLFTGIPFEISRAERVRGTGKRVRESVQQRPLPAEGKTHANAAVSVRRRPGQPTRSDVRVGY